MKKLKGFKISAFLSLGIHLFLFFLLTIFFKDLDLKTSSPPNRPLEVFLSKIIIEPQLKMVSDQKSPLKPEPLTYSEPEKNPSTSVAFEPSRFFNTIEDEPRVVSLKKPFPLMVESDVILEENHSPMENNSTVKNNSPAENHQIPENSKKIEKRVGEVEGEKEPEKPVLQFPSSEIPLEVPKGNLYAKKEIPLIFPRYVENPKPVYPREARIKGYEGEVILRVEVLTNGHVGQIEIRRSSGYETLDRSAIEAIKKWRFIPAQKGEERVTFWVNIPIRFQLQ